MPSLPTGPGLRRLIVVTAAIAVAAAPALTGLRGNESFAQSVPVSVPRDATVLSAAYFEDREPQIEASASASEKERHTKVATGSDDTKASPLATPTRAAKSPSASSTKKRASAKPTARPTEAPKKQSGKHPKPARKPSPTPTVEPSPSASIDDHGGATPSTDPSAPAAVPTSDAPTPAATVDDHGGGGSGHGGGGGSGKGGGGNQ